jgi:hypothetical protein
MVDWAAGILLGSTPRPDDICAMPALQRLVFVGLFISMLIITGAAAVPTADEVLAKARATATAEHKSIFLLFDASW